MDIREVIPTREELPPPQKLRAKQVSQRYSIGLSTVWLYAKQGRLTPLKVSDKVTVFDVAECDKLFSSEVL